MLNYLYLNLLVLDQNINRILYPNILTNNVSRDSGTPDPEIMNPVLDFLKGWGLIGLSFIMGALVVFLPFMFFKVFFRFKKASADGDEQGKSQAIKDMLGVSVGFVLCMVAGTLAAVFGGVFISQ